MSNVQSFAQYVAGPIFSFRFGDSAPGSSQWVLGELIGEPPRELSSFKKNYAWRTFVVPMKPRGMQRVWSDQELVYDAAGGAA